MIVFQNPGLIELAAVTTMGVSVKNAGSFGRFGTGIKYGVASVLRGGGSITIHRGSETHHFTIETEEVRGKPFDFVCLDGVRIGFTTQLGIDWKPWMVLREFGCNALDEGGSFYQCDDCELAATDDQTAIVIRWPELDTAFQQKADLFLEGEPLFENEAIRVLPGPSAHLFYRGIRVFKMEKPSQFTYDILTEQYLTEDRTLAGSWGADRIIRDTILAMDNAELIRQAITTGEQYHEAAFNFKDAGYEVKPSTEFLKAATIAREGDDKEKLSKSARDVLSQASRAQQAEERTSRRQVQNDAFQEAIAYLYELGMEFADDQSFVEVNELPGEARSVLENGTVFMLKVLMNAAPREIAGELIRRWVDLQPNVYGIDSTVALLVPKLLDAVPNAKREREYQEKLAAEEALRAAARAERDAADAARLEIIRAELAARADQIVETPVDPDVTP